MFLFHEKITMTMRYPVLLFFIFISHSLVWGGLRIEPEFVDLGTVYAGNQSTSRTVSIINDTVSPLRIDKIVSSCSCILPKIPCPFDLRAQEKMNIPVQINFGPDTKKNFSNMIFLLHEDVASSITIKANVLQEINCPEFYSIVKGPEIEEIRRIYFSIDPEVRDSINFGEITSSDKRLHGKIIRDAALTWLEITIDSSYPVGTYDATLHFSTNCKGKSKQNISITISIKVTDNFTKKTIDDSSSSSASLFGYDYFQKTEKLKYRNCGPRCLVHMLHHYGIRPNVTELINQVNYSGVGTSMLEIKRVASIHGLKLVGVRIAYDALVGDYLPCIALTRSNDHYIYIFSRQHGKIYYFDPIEESVSVKTDDEVASEYGGYILYCPRADLKEH